MKLYELTNQYAALSDLDMPTEDLQDTFDALDGEIQIKAENLLSVVANMDANKTAINTEIKRLQARKSGITNRQTAMREYLRFQMENCGIKKITCDLFTITRGTGRPIALVDDVDKLPARFVKTTLTKQPIKADILKALKDGIDVPGALIGSAKESLIIR